MTDAERTLVLTALLWGVHRLPGGGTDTMLAGSRQDLTRLSVDAGAAVALLRDDPDSPPDLHQTLQDACRLIEAARPISPPGAWATAVNPFAMAQLGTLNNRPPTRCAAGILTSEALLQAGDSDALPSGMIGQLSDALARCCSAARDFDDLVWRILALEVRYLWFAPWSAGLDLPFPQTARLLAATALCLHRAGPTEAPMRLVVGDLSGIQQFIGAVTTAQDWSGAARRLRARSLYLQLLSDVAAHQVLHALDLGPAHIIMSGGGRFVLLVPDTGPGRASLQELAGNWDRWLYQELDGEVRLHLASCAVSSSDLAHAGDLFARASASLAAAKLAPLAGVMKQDGRWADGVFVGPAVGAICAGCGRGLAHDGGNVCARCNREVEAGRLLTRTNRLAYRRDGDGLIPMLGYSVDLLAAPDKAAGSSYLVAATGFGEDPKTFATPVRTLATHVPVRNGEPIRFEELAGLGTRGRGYLGYLKLDVDRLGALFSWGLRREGEPGYDALSRIMAMSDWLEWFFGGYVADLAAQREWDDIYLVFAGGDDLLAIGPWERALAFAAKVHEGFSLLCAASSSVTVSAGVAPSKPRYPVAQMVRRAAVELSTAKQGTKHVPGRDSIGVLGDCISWARWSEVDRAVNLLADTEGVPGAVVQTLLECARLWRRFHQGNTGAARFVPLLYYTRQRTVSPARQPALSRYLDQLARLPLDAEGAARLDHLGTVARLAAVARTATDNSRR